MTATFTANPYPTQRKLDDEEEELDALAEDQNFFGVNLEEDWF